MANGLPDYTGFLSANKDSIKPANTNVTTNYSTIFDQNMAFLVAAAAAELTAGTTTTTPRSLSEFAIQVLQLKQQIIYNEKLMLLGADIATTATNSTTTATKLTTFTTDFTALKARGEDEELGIVSRGVALHAISPDNRGLVRMALDNSGMTSKYISSRQQEIDTPMIPTHTVGP